MKKYFIKFISARVQRRTFEIACVLAVSAVLGAVWATTCRSGSEARAAAVCQNGNEAGAYKATLCVEHSSYFDFSVYCREEFTDEKCVEGMTFFDSPADYCEDYVDEPCDSMIFYCWESLAEFLGAGLEDIIFSIWNGWDKGVFSPYLSVYAGDDIFNIIFRSFLGEYLDDDILLFPCINMLFAYHGICPIAAGRFFLQDRNRAPYLAGFFLARASFHACSYCGCTGGDFMGFGRQPMPGPADKPDAYTEIVRVYRCSNCGKETWGIHVTEFSAG